MRMTKAQWAAKVRHGYAEVRNGQRYALVLTAAGTALVKVEVV